MSNNQGNNGCNAQQGTTCSFIAAQENLLMTLKELTRGQKDLNEKVSTQIDTLHKIEIRLERGDSALANASCLAKDVEDLKLWRAGAVGAAKDIDDLKMWRAKAEGSALMLKWLIGLAVGGGAAGVISIVLFLAKGHP